MLIVLSLLALLVASFETGSFSMLFCMPREGAVTSRVLAWNEKGGSSLLAVQASWLTVEFFCLQAEVPFRRAFPLKAKKLQL